MTTVKGSALMILMSRDTEQMDRINKLFAEITSRSGATYTPSAISGDGYWCPIHSGSCFSRCEDRRWGRYGAAGVLFFHRESGTFLLNQRSKAIHFGGTWSTIGGALDKGETAFEGALREATEEIGHISVDYWQIAESKVIVTGAEGEWAYTTIVVEVSERWDADTSDWETMDNAWVSVNDMATMALHPGFKASVTGLVREMYLSGAFNKESK